MSDQQVAALVSALQRTEANFIAAVNGKPVRDMTENLAENRAALRDLESPMSERSRPGIAHE